MLEMVLVLAIGALMAGIALPRMGNATSRYQLDFAARQLVLDFERARTNARLTSATQTVTFNLTNSQYTVTGGAGTSRGFTTDFSVAPYRCKISSTSFGSPAKATFDAYGQPALGGTVILTAGGATRTITLSAGSGKASWQ